MSNAPSVTLRAVERAPTTEGYIVASTHTMTDQEISDLLGAAQTLASRAAVMIGDRGDRVRWSQATDLLIEARFQLARRDGVADRFSSAGFSAMSDEDRTAYRARKLADADRVAVDLQARLREARADSRERAGVA